MKIAVFVPSFPALSEIFILNQIIGLIERGHKVDIYAMQTGDFQNLHSDVNKYRLMERTRYQLKMPQNYFVRVIKAIALIAYNYKRICPMVLLRSVNVFKYGRIAASLGLLYSSIPLLRQNKYDVIHCQFGPLGSKALKLRGIGAISGKIVTSFRGYDITKHIYNKLGIYNDLFREGDLFFPVCQAFKQRLIKEGCEERKIIVHHSGIDTANIKYTVRQRAKGEPTKILTIARLVEKKGVAYPIRAIARLISSGRRVSYSVVGDGELRSDLEQLIKDLGIESEVLLLGRRNHEEVLRLIQDAHVLVAPSVTAANGDQEGIPNVLKEAMASGLPVLSTQHSGIPELVQNGISGFLVPERDVDALTEKLEYFIDHPEKWPEMGRNGRNYVKKHYDINKLNDRLVKIYEQVLN